MAVNGLYIVQGESNAVVALLKKAHRGWSHHQQQLLASHLDETDPLLRNFTDLRDVLYSVSDLSDMSPDTFVSPFLEVIRSDQTNGPVTAQALSSVAKFLSYGLIDSGSIKASNAVENISKAVTHAKFVGSADSAADEVVLLKILQVLRTLLLTPVGRLLSNESVCELMQSCLRICFEGALSELLRKAAESTLADMTQLIFTRLPSFKQDIRDPYIRRLVKKVGGAGGKRKRRKATSAMKEVLKHESVSLEPLEEKEKVSNITLANSAKSFTDVKDVCADLPTSATNAAQVIDKAADVEPGEGKETDMGNQNATASRNLLLDNDDSSESVKVSSKIDEQSLNSLDESISPNNGDIANPENDVEGTSHLNQEGIVLASNDSDSELKHENDQEKQKELIQDKMRLQAPYGLPCARELFRFLIGLANPLDRANTESMILMGLNLLTVALEAGADHIRNYTLLMALVKNELCRSLTQLLDTEKLPVFAATNRVFFLLFESLRTDLKFQMEAYFHKLKTIVSSERSRVSYEQVEMALESIVQFWRVPGLVTELYLNYDCDLYCSNLFEDLTKLLLENAFPVTGLRSTHILSLDALLTVIDTIDVNCVYRQSGNFQKPLSSSSINQLRLPAISGYTVGRQIANSTSTERLASLENSALMEMLLPSAAVRANRMASSLNIPSPAEVIERKKQKRILTEGTELFNQDPKKGVHYLMEKGILKTPLDPNDVVSWLRANPQLDKKKIADYICSRKNLPVLEAFVQSFQFENTRMDEALRMFLETFRLPGEAAEISMVMQHFSDHWYQANGEPFNHADAAFTLAYAIIMLNTDQHNPQVRRNQPPMQLECFKRNLSGTNGGQDFDPEMLELMYNSIRSEEIVMPAEQTGLVKENYMWKVLLRRGETKEGEFIHAPAGWNDYDLFAIIWGPATAALSFVFDKTEQESILQKSLNGYRKCASIAAHYGMSDVFDNLIIHLCKFSTLMTSTEGNDDQNLERQHSTSLPEMTSHSAEQAAMDFAENTKAQMAAKAMFQLVHTHGDILREGWKNVLDCILYLFHARLLPSVLTEVEDFVDPKGWVSIQRKPAPKLVSNRNDSGLLSWLGLGSSGNETRDVKTISDQQQLIKTAENIVAECHTEQLVTDGKYLTSSALTELITALLQASTTIALVSDVGSNQSSKKLNEQSEDGLILYLELVISITQENKDRLSQIWPSVKRHLQWLMSGFGKNPHIVERAVVGLLRIANRNLFRLKDGIAEEVLQSLNMLLELPPPAMFMFSRQIAYGLHELLRTNAANVHRTEHWALLFALLEACGAAAYAEDQNLHVNSEDIRGKQSIVSERNAFSDTESRDLHRMSLSTSSDVVTEDRGYASDDLQRTQGSFSSFLILSDHGDSSRSLVKDASTEWVYLEDKDGIQRQSTEPEKIEANKFSLHMFDRGTILLRPNLARHDPAAFLKVGEILSFLIRDAAHITPENFDSCVHCLRAYSAGPLSGDVQNHFRSISKDRSRRMGKASEHMQVSAKTAKDSFADSKSGNDQQELSTSYLQISLQMLDLCHTLHSKAAYMYKSWADGSDEVDASTPALWVHCWRPLLQCTARLCCDCRRQVRTQALNYLVRSFLIPEMQVMNASDWENCFVEVLFPLLHKLLENLSPMDPIGMEETRVRAMQLVSKIFLNHLTPLSSLLSFKALWLKLLDTMDKYLHTERSDLLSESIPESLKNMILVMDSTGLFSSIPQIYELTTARMSVLLPELLAEVMPGPPTATCNSGSLEPVITDLKDNAREAVVSDVSSEKNELPIKKEEDPTSRSQSAAGKSCEVKEVIAENKVVSEESEAAVNQAPFATKDSNTTDEHTLEEVIVQSNNANPYHRTALKGFPHASTHMLFSSPSDLSRFGNPYVQTLSQAYQISPPCIGPVAGNSEINLNVPHYGNPSQASGVPVVTCSAYQGASSSLLYAQATGLPFSHNLYLEGSSVTEQAMNSTSIDQKSFMHSLPFSPPQHFPNLQTNSQNAAAEAQLH